MQHQPAVAFPWLTGFYSLAERGQLDEAIDLLFDHIDELLLEGEFTRCNALLQRIDLERLETNLIVAILSITLAAAQQLPQRAQLCERAHARLLVLAPKRAERLLSGLC